jgi:iron uptake system component EfeO
MNHGRIPVLTAGIATLGLVASACSSTMSASTGTSSGGDAAVAVTLTPQGCAPSPAKVAAGHIAFNVTNKNADAVSEAELRSSDGSHILGEQENLTPGLSGGFSLSLQAGTYQISCPGAASSTATFTVTGAKAGTTWQSDARLTAAVRGYAAYVTTNVNTLISNTQAFCDAIDAGDMARAKLLYPTARVPYERVEPVAEIWGDLDTAIDGRWENPVTVASQFVGFHRIEQLMWEDDTLTGAPALCTGLLGHERQLLTLVTSATYSPLEMAAGATDLINEAATAKITGEEDRYSNVDFIDFTGNIDGAREVVTLLTPYLKAVAPSALTTVAARLATLESQLSTYKRSPGYDDTGFVEYSTVLDAQRRQLSAAVNAYAEALSKISTYVSD